MSLLGQGGILLGLVLACYGAVVAAVGARKGRPALVESARRCAFVLLGITVLVNGVMLAALLRNDFTLRYVAENSSLSTPTFYKVLALWAADDGSLLLWNLVLAGYLAAVAYRFRHDRPPTFPYALSVLLAVQAFYLTVVSGPARPFAVLAAAPEDGRGPSPLLQNHPLMAVHPPFLYLGFIGFTVPFAFGIAALLVGRTGATWAATARRWTLAVWCFLTVGLLLGGLWSYSVLGWGGYWAWDPVENVALLPWLVATAFVHSSMLEKRRGIGRLWNAVLVICAFALMTFGTFLTRGNVLTSIHAFTESAVGPAYLIFLTVVLLGGFGLVAWRLPELRGPARLDSALSREGAFVGNNVLLLSAAAIVLLGTAFPLVVEAATGDQITIGAPYFRTALAPVFLLLLLLVGIAPRLGWRTTDRARAVRALRVPAVVAASVVVGTALSGVRQPEAVAGLGLAALVATSNGQAVVWGVLRGRRGGRAGLLATLRQGRRHYAGLVVHVGLAVLAAGITASSALARQTEVTLSVGQTASFDGYRLRYDGVRARTEPQRAVLTASVAVTDARGRGRRPLQPRMNLYPRASEPIGSPSIHRGPVWDLYASLISLQDNGGAATFRFYHNPGVNWLWCGGALMVLGGLAAAWPGGRRRRESEVPVEVSTTRRKLTEVGAA
jgi:cytochrome c-type biogenesis protein CcmF